VGVPGVSDDDPRINSHSTRMTRMTRIPADLNRSDLSFVGSVLIRVIRVIRVEWLLFVTRSAIASRLTADDGLLYVRRR
jgi:hypothetical protein